MYTMGSVSSTRLGAVKMHAGSVMVVYTATTLCVVSKCEHCEHKRLTNSGFSPRNHTSCMGVGKQLDPSLEIHRGGRI